MWLLVEKKSHEHSQKKKLRAKRGRKKAQQRKREQTKNFEKRFFIKHKQKGEKKGLLFCQNIWCSKGLTALFEDSFDFLRNAPRLSFGAGNFFTFFFFRESEREREFVGKK